MSYSRSTSSSAGTSTKWIVLLVGALVIVAAVSVTVLIATGLIDRSPFGITRTDTELIELWNGGEYRGVIELSERILDESPFEGQALTFGGFAYFYVGIDALDEDERSRHIERSIQLLRKSWLAQGAPLAAERAYVMGKAYFHRGDSYSDLAIRYLERSIDDGYESSDTWSYLGLANAAIGDYPRSAEWFLLAIDRAAEAGDGPALQTLRIRAAETLSALEQFTEAERLLRAAIAELNDTFLLLLARNRLSELLVADGRYQEAERETAVTLEEFPDSADAHYYLGVVYYQTERAVEARNQWRTTRQLDPNHAAALARLAGTWEN